MITSLRKEAASLFFVLSLFLFSQSPTIGKSGEPCQLPHLSVCLPGQVPFKGRLTVLFVVAFSVHKLSKCIKTFFLKSQQKYGMLINLILNLIHLKHSTPDNQTIHLYELRYETFINLVKNADTGLTIVVLVDEESKPHILRKFAEIMQPYSR